MLGRLRNQSCFLHLVCMSVCLSDGLLQTSSDDFTETWCYDWTYQWKELMAVIWFWIWILDHFSTSPPTAKQGIFRRFIFLIHSPANFQKKMAKWLTPITEWIHYILEAIRRTLRSGNLDSNPGSLVVEKIVGRPYKFSGHAVVQQSAMLQGYCDED